MSEFMDIMQKVKNTSELLVIPYQFGFVRGHAYLSDSKIRSVKEMLDEHNGKTVVAEYESRMSGLIGRGYGISYASGRMAFFSLLKEWKVGQGDEVILPAFTCSVMPNAVWRAGAKPVFADIDKDTFGSGAEQIEKKIMPRTKVIVAQHSFGIPCGIRKITELGKRKGILVVEDSAISLDSTVDGVTVGNWGDAAIFSTDHSKPINTLVGGFLYTRDKNLHEKLKSRAESLSGLNKEHQERLYDQFLHERECYLPSRYPRTKLFSRVRNQLNRIRPVRAPYTFFDADYGKQPSCADSYPYPAKMPPFLAQLGLFELDNWPDEKKRRKAILKEYINVMDGLGLRDILPKAYNDANVDIVPLRLAFEYSRSGELVEKMARFVDVDWVWFRHPVICSPGGPESLGYEKGSCAAAEEIGRRIVNWPCIITPGWEERILQIFKNVMKGCR